MMDPLPNDAGVCGRNAGRIVPGTNVIPLTIIMCCSPNYFPMNFTDGVVELSLIYGRQGGSI